MKRRRLLQGLGLAGVMGLLGGLFTARTRANPYYSGPPSDHFDGETFFLPGRRRPDTGIVDLIRWRFGETREPWPTKAPSPHRDRPPARVEGPELRVSFIGHASALLQTRGVNILCDPVYADRVSPISFLGPKRVNEPGIAFDDLPPIDAVLVTHNHYDHLDVATLSRLWHRHRPRLITPLGNDTIMRGHDAAIKAEAFDWHDEVELADGVLVHLLPTQHWSARRTSDRNAALWAAFTLTTPEGPVYLAGDTGYGEGEHLRDAARRFGPFRFALLPIGAYEPRWFMEYSHMNPEEAVRSFRDLEAKKALAIHWGTFRLTDEGIDDPPTRLANARRQAGLSEDDFVVLPPGGVVTLT